MPYRQNFPIPPVIDPPHMCLQLEIPNSPEWKAIVSGLIYELTYWFNYERDGSNNGALCAAVWKKIYQRIDWSDMSCCCGEFDILYIWTEDGELEQSTDGGVTYTPAPQSDPRNSSPVFPPVPGDASEDKKCIAATGMSLLVKEGIGDQLTDDMGRYTVGQLINDWVKTVIQTSNPFEALIQVVTNQIFALLISAVRAALTDPVYAQLTCIFYCNISEDLSFDDASWAVVRSDILSQISGIAGVFLEHLVFLLGKVGLTNLARSQAATEGDCGDCSCSDSCSALWDVMPGAGVVLSTSDNEMQVQASLSGSDYYCIIASDDINNCCLVTEVINDVGIFTLTGWTDCGQPQIEGAPQHTGIFGYGSYCVNLFHLQSAIPFTVTIHFAGCP